MTETSFESKPGNYEIVGWLSITSAVLLLPSMVLGLVLDLGRSPAISIFLVPYALLFGASMGLSLYALHRFKGLLNDRYEFHDVDNIITAIIILGCVMGVVALGVRTAGTMMQVNTQDPMTLLPMVLVGVGFFALIGLPLSILNIVFAVRLLRLRDSLYGLLKPYAFTTIVASAFFATFLLAFVGLFLDAACSVMLGLVFLRASRGLPEPEFV